MLNKNILILCIIVQFLYSIQTLDPTLNYEIDHTEELASCSCTPSSLNTATSTRTSDHNRLKLEYNHSNEILQYLNSKMIYIPSSEDSIGTNKPFMKNDGESPMRKVKLSSYWLDKYEVSNNDFKLFIDSTNYTTESEIFGWSFVFHTAIPEFIKSEIHNAVLGAEWWLPVNGAYWRSPEGVIPNTDVFISNRSNHPVIQVSWNDANEYCTWRNARLPTEAEWESASNGPQKTINTSKLYPWGYEFTPNKQYRANIFQGNFPNYNTVSDGYEFTAPVDAFEPQNDYGLYNMIGNVWEWVSDWHSLPAKTTTTDISIINPQGPDQGTDKVKKGGSFLCHRSYCYRYRNVARSPSTPDSATYNIGFRCAMDSNKHHQYYLVEETTTSTSTLLSDNLHHHVEL